MIKISLLPPTWAWLCPGPGLGLWLGAELAYLALHERPPQTLSPALHCAQGRVPAQRQLANSILEFFGVGALALQKFFAVHADGDHQGLIGVKGFQYLLPQREKVGSGTLKTVTWGSF